MPKRHIHLLRQTGSIRVYRPFRVMLITFSIMVITFLLGNVVHGLCVQYEENSDRVFWECSWRK